MSTKLEPPDLHHLSAAYGWMGLSNLVEAKAELSLIGPALRNHPDVLEARWQVCAEEKNWEEGLQIARQLIHAAPEKPSGWLHQAYALRRVPEATVKHAWEALLPAFDMFPKEPVICYNLSCYACQMGQLEAARVWLKRAMVLDSRARILEMALADTDLKELWPELRRP